jgi:hypothetical protein
LSIGDFAGRAGLKISIRRRASDRWIDCLKSPFSARRRALSLGVLSMLAVPNQFMLLVTASTCQLTEGRDKWRREAERLRDLIEQVRHDRCSGDG